MQIVPEEVLRDLVREPEALAAVEHAFAALARDEVVQPPPMGLDIAEARGEIHVKGAYLVGSPVFAIKVASGFYNNASLGLPTGSGLILVFDAGTGQPMALLQDNAYLTDLRTAAAGALAAKHLAPKVVGSVAVIGAGVQARFQMRAISQVLEWKEARVWSPIPEEVERYREEMTATLGDRFLGAGSPQEAVEGCDLVVTVTPSREPLLERGWVRPGSTVIAVGSDGPDKQELSAELVAAADKIVVDRLDQCVRLGEVHHAVAAGHLAPSDVYAELGEIVVGRKPGREGGELIVCDLTGVGAQDAAIAEEALRVVG